jgi:hypothetical protein
MISLFKMVIFHNYVESPEQFNSSRLGLRHKKQRSQKKRFFQQLICSREAWQSLNQFIPVSLRVQVVSFHLYRLSPSICSWWFISTWDNDGLKEPSGPQGVEDAIYRITSAMEQQTLLEMACGIDDLRRELGSNHVKPCQTRSWWNMVKQLLKQPKWGCNHVSPPKCRFRYFF